MSARHGRVDRVSRKSNPKTVHEQKVEHKVERLEVPPHPPVLPESMVALSAEIVVALPRGHAVDVVEIRGVHAEAEVRERDVDTGGDKNNTSLTWENKK